MLQISDKEIYQRLRADNPWWRSPDDVGRKDDPQRIYFTPFYELIRTTKVNRAIVLMGPRRVGKTFMAHQAVARLIKENISPQNVLYIPLDNPLYADLSLEKILLNFLDLNRVPQNETAYLFFDEIQYLKNWEIHLKSLVDTYPQHRFIATGSAAAALKLKSNESGAGRFTDFVLPSLTFYEYIKFIGVAEKKRDWTEEKNTGRLNEHFVDYINFGGYPEAAVSEDIRKDPDRFIKNDIIDRVLLKDLPSLYGINDIRELYRLFIALAYNTGQEVNLPGLSQSANVAKGTLSKYLEYLEAAFLIKRVRRVDNNAKRFKRDHKFKVYLTNPSMYAALFGTTDDESQEAKTVMGHLVETAVFSNTFRIARHENYYYGRWGKQEVDLVSMDSLGTKADLAIEIKWSNRPCDDLSEIKGLLDFATKQKLKPEENNVLCLTKSKYGRSRKYKSVWAQFVPASCYCFHFGQSAE